MSPRAGLDVCGKYRPTRFRSLDRPACSEYLYQLSYILGRYNVKTVNSYGRFERSKRLHLEDQKV
jgi:hypothetical protein